MTRIMILALLMVGSLYANKFHVLEQITPGTFRIVVHYLTATTDNNEDVSWTSIKSTLQTAQTDINSFGGSAHLIVGNPAGPGEITNSENNNLLNGTNTEFSYSGEVGLVDAKITEDREAFEIKYSNYGQLGGAVE